MNRTRGRRKPKAGRRPVAPPIRDPGHVRALDSEDQSGTYAPARSPYDTGESDEGVFAQGPLPARHARRKPPGGGAAMRPKKKRTGRVQPDAIADEIPDTIGGTDGAEPEKGDDEDWVKAEIGEGGGYGRAQETGEEEDLF